MSFIFRSSTVALATFLCALFGAFLHRHLPELGVQGAHTVLTPVVALLATFLSIVLGLLISSSYNLFNTQQSDLQTVVSTIAHIDFLFRQIGPATASARNILQQQTHVLRSRFWPDEIGVGRSDVTYDCVMADVQVIEKIIGSLQPISDEGQQELAEVRQLCGKLVEVQMTMIRNLSNRMPNLLLGVIFGWACILFMCFGLGGSVSVYDLFIVGLGSLAVASASYLIFELTDPYRGLFRVSSAAVDLLMRTLES